MPSAPKFHLAILLPSERPSFEMSEWASRIAQNCVGSVPVAVSPGPGAGSEPPKQTTTSIPNQQTNPCPGKTLLSTSLSHLKKKIPQQLKKPSRDQSKTYLSCKIL